MITIDIIKEVINTTCAVGRYKGEEVSNLLKSHIDELMPSSVLQIDFSNAKDLDYVFCQHAFGSLIKMIQESNKPTLFTMQNFHKRCFYRGVLKRIDQDLPRNSSVEDSEKVFVSAGMFIMMKVGEKKEIDFIGDLNPIDDSILAFINNAKEKSEREIIDSKKEFEPTEITDSLRSLSRKGFILTPANGSHNYCSIYTQTKI